nr:hypothetical protein [Tanacetum cinerariifolium]
MSRDVITVGSTMRIPLLYRGEYSQWRERFMNYLEEQTDGEAMINSIQNGDQPLPVIAKCHLLEMHRMHLLLSKIQSFRLLKRNRVEGLIMCGSEYDEQNRKAAILYEYETFKATEGEQLLDTYLRYLQVINDLKKCGYKKDNSDVNGALGYKKKAVVITSDPLALVAEKTKVSKRKEKVVVSSDSDGSGAYDFSELKKITALLIKAFNRRKFYSKPTNNNLRTSSTSQKDILPKTARKKRSKITITTRQRCCQLRKIVMNKCFLLRTKLGWSPVVILIRKSMQTWSSWLRLKRFFKIQTSTEETIAEVAYYTSESESESEFETLEYYDNSTNYDLFMNNDDDQEIFMMQLNLLVKISLQNHIDSQKDYDKSEVDHNDSEEKEHLFANLIRTFNHKIAKCQKRIEKANQQSKDLENQNKDFQEKYDVLLNQVNTFEEQNNEFNEQIKVLNKNNADLLAQTEVLQDQLKTIHMIMPSKDTLYNGRKGTGFKNPSYFEKAKDLRPSLYDEKVIGLGYTSMFLIHSDEALEIEKFKRARENKIVFSYDYGNLNASYVNEKINFSDDYFQEITNPDFEKIDSPFQQTSSLKPYVLNVILEKIIIDLEDEVLSLLEKEKANLKTIESLKSKGFELSENAISESENQSEKECDQVENSKVIAPGMFMLSMSQSVSPISLSKMSRASKNIENLDTFSSVRRPKHSGVIWKKKGSVGMESSIRIAPYEMCDLFDENNLFIFDDDSVRISPVSKMPFRKKPRDSINAYNKRTRKIHESVNVNFDEISEMASKQFSLEPGLSNLNETGKSSNQSVSHVSEASKQDLEDLF